MDEDVDEHVRRPEHARLDALAFRVGVVGELVVTDAIAVVGLGPEIRRRELRSAIGVAITPNSSGCEHLLGRFYL